MSAENITTESTLKARPLGNDADGLAETIAHYLHYTFGRDDATSAPHDTLVALALTLRDRMMDGAARTRAVVERSGARRACYLSMEYLLGRSLGNAALALDLEAPLAGACAQLGIDLEAVAESEHDAGLGNGGLGRLAACFLDSAASLGLPLTGYGLRYRYGMFRQRIVAGAQVEAPDHWLRDGHPWEIERPELTVRVRFGGHTRSETGADGRLRVHWVDTHDVLAVPFDVPIPGYRNGVTNTLRLWSSAATDEFDLDEFNAGGYPESVAAKNAAEHISMVLYPNDATENGKVLRLRQQYLLAAASLGDVVRDWVRRRGENFEQFANYHVFQLNDTHPSLAVAELMRILLDEHGLEWDAAWTITSHSMAYTNHTLLPEALERWPLRLLRELLPRPLAIIEEINARFLGEVEARFPGDVDRLRSLSIIEEGDEKMVRMAHLAVVGSYSVNGVAALHTQLLCKGLFADFHAMYPTRFNNKTNGITPRRWLAGCNPRLGALLDDAVGDAWRFDLNALESLRAHLGDVALGERWRAVKRANKVDMSALVRDACGVEFDPDWQLSAQVKRIHEYKRQLLNVLHVVHLYLRAQAGEPALAVPRAVLIAGKAAPGYLMAKLIIEFANAVAAKVNADPVVNQCVRVAFLPNYRVSSMEIICPAAEISEQISTAGKEASGTGNMKFMANGAVTVGTRDGANIEIFEAVGDGNFHAFGLDADAVAERRAHYAPHEVVAADADLAAVVELLRSDHFGPRWQFAPIVDAMLSPHDPWMTVADFRAYVDAQARAASDYADTALWTRMSMANTASCGRFSSDRTIAAYNEDIWRLTPLELHSDASVALDPR